METNEISIHEIKVFNVVSRSGWIDNKTIAKEAGISGRTARAHTLKLSKLGIFDCAEVFPGHRYRVATKAEKRNAGYLQRIARAKEVFGELAD